MRHGDRQTNELRPIQVQRNFTQSAPGSVLIQAGRTTVLCTACIEESVPPWKASQENPTGWVTAEYSMLPGSTTPRKRRERGKLDGRSSEIQRLIGRSLRAAVDLDRLGEMKITIDCDVIEADGGTSTASITGAWVAMAMAIEWMQDKGMLPTSPLRTQVAATSAGMLNGELLLDLDYQEDSNAGVDFNVVMLGTGQLVEVQGTAEGEPFSREQMNSLIDLAERGIRELLTAQQEALKG